MEIKHCAACGQDWCFRGTGRPLRCGKCKSPYWDRGRKPGNAPEEVRRTHRDLRSLLDELIEMLRKEDKALYGEDEKV